jgi:lysophospholipase L1-like esterase
VDVRRRRGVSICDRGVDLFYGDLATPVVEESSYFTSNDGSGTYGSDAASNAFVGGDSATLNFIGDIGWVRVFNRKLTLAEIQLEQYSKRPMTTGCVLDSEYHGTGTQMDRSGNGNNGTVTGASVADHPVLSSGRASRPIRFTESTQDIPVTNTALFFSPYTTFSDGSGTLGSNNVLPSSTFARWTTPGSYLTFKTTIASGGAGTVKLLLDTTSLSGLTANECPILSYGYDDRPHSTNQPAFSGSPVVLTLATGLAAGTYTFRVEFKAIGLNTPGDRWSTPAQSVRITGIRIDATGSVSAPTRRANSMIYFGDSIGEGAGAIAAADPNGDVNATDNDAIQAFPSIIARVMEAEIGVIAYGGAGYTRGIDNQVASSSNPSLYSATSANRFYDKYSSGASRLVSGAFSPVPDFIVIMAGANDVSLSAAEVTAAIDAIRTAAGVSCWIFVVPDPLPSQPTTAIQNGVLAAAQQARTKYITLTQLYAPGTPNRYSSDAGVGGSHANVRGHAVFAAEMIGLIQGKICPRYILTRP